MERRYIDRSPDTRAAAWALRETEATWPPGTHFYYSDAGYQVLALVLEEVMGQPFQDILRAHIFEPLGMTASEPAFVHATRSRMAKGYRHLYDDRPPHASHPLVPAAWIEMNAGDCCIASTAEDPARFARMLLNRGQGPAGPLLSSAGYELLIHEPVATEYGFAYGYGIKVHQTNFRVVLRKGALWLVWPAGGEEPLTPVREGVFRVGDEISPERLRFSQVVDGQELCANLSGSDYYRFFTP